MSPTTSTRWYTAFPCAEPPRLRLVCFPYAGGTAAGYRAWHSRLPPWCQVCAIQLPGRANRYTEPCIVDFAELVRELSAAVVPLLDVPVAFYGHSLGAILAFEVSRALRREIGVTPRRLIVSGRRAPDVRDTDRPLHDANEAELIAYLRDQGGTPPEVLENPELLRIALPALRGDLRLLKSHRFVEEEPLACPVSVYGGRTDPESEHGWLEAWCRHTTAACAVQMLPGGHFFIQTEQHDFLARLAGELSAALRPSPPVTHSGREAPSRAG